MCQARLFCNHPFLKKEAYFKGGHRECPHRGHRECTQSLFKTLKGIRGSSPQLCTDPCGHAHRWKWQTTFASMPHTPSRWAPKPGASGGHNFRPTAAHTDRTGSHTRCIGWTQRSSHRSAHQHSGLPYQTQQVGITFVPPQRTSPRRAPTQDASSGHSARPTAVHISTVGSHTRCSRWA